MTDHRWTSKTKLEISEDLKEIEKRIKEKEELIFERMKMIDRKNSILEGKREVEISCPSVLRKRPEDVNNSRLRAALELELFGLENKIQNTKIMTKSLKNQVSELKSQIESRKREKGQVFRNLDDPMIRAKAIVDRLIDSEVEFEPLFRVLRSLLRGNDKRALEEFSKIVLPHYGDEIADLRLMFVEKTKELDAIHAEFVDLSDKHSILTGQVRKIRAFLGSHREDSYDLEGIREQIAMLDAQVAQIVSMRSTLDTLVCRRQQLIEDIDAGALSDADSEGEPVDDVIETGGSNRVLTGKETKRRDSEYIEKWSEKEKELDDLKADTARLVLEEKEMNAKFQSLQQRIGELETYKSACIEEIRSVETQRMEMEGQMKCLLQKMTLINKAGLQEPHEIAYIVSICDTCLPEDLIEYVNESVAEYEQNTRKKNLLKQQCKKLRSDIVSLTNRQAEVLKQQESLALNIS